MSRFSISGVVVEVRSNVAKTRPQDDTATSRGLNLEQLWILQLYGLKILL